MSKVTDATGKVDHSMVYLFVHPICSLLLFSFVIANACHVISQMIRRWRRMKPLRGKNTGSLKGRLIGGEDLPSGGVMVVLAILSSSLVTLALGHRS